MRLVTYANGDQTGVGVERDGKVIFAGYADMLELIRDGDKGLARARAAHASGKTVAFDRLLAPIPRPGKIFGCGVNYRSHGDEEPGFVFPDEPAVDFIKLSSAVVGPDADIVIPTTDGVIKRPDGFNVDYEVELGVVSHKRPGTFRRRRHLTMSSATRFSTTLAPARFSSRTGRSISPRASTRFHRWGPVSSRETRCRILQTCTFSPSLTARCVRTPAAPT